MLSRFALLFSLSISFFLGISSPLMAESEPSDNGQNQLEKKLPDKRQASLEGSVPVGALVPLTGLPGSLSSLGSDVGAGIKKSVSDFNAKLQMKNAGWSIELNMQDTQANPAIALSQLRMLKENGTNLVLGPVTSASVNTAKALAQNQNETLLFSCCSVATSHSTPGDGLFRLVPDSDTQGAFFVQELLNANISTIVLVYREDTWGIDLSEAIRTGFTDKGGTVTMSLPYPRANPNAVSIVGEVQSAINGLENLDNTAVVILSFDEITGILEQSYRQASSEAMDLDDLRWFGAATTYPEIIENSDARKFAEKVQYTTFILEIDRSSTLYAEVRSVIMETLGISREPDVHSYIAYDTAQILGKAIEEADSDDPVAIIDQLPSVAKNYDGFVGNAMLNENGDLAQGNYQIWQVSDGQWQRATSGAVNLVRNSVIVLFSANLLAFFAAY